jgi:uncharacterized protein YkwD
MLDRRLLALMAAVLLTVGLGLAWGGVPEGEVAIAIPVTEPRLEPVSDTPETLETAALLDTEVLDLQAVESELIDQALISTTTTHFTKTSTIPPSTTSTPTPRRTAPPASSPPTTSPPATTAGPTHDSGAEGQFASSINSYRSSNGLPALSRSGSLDSYARNWALQLVENGSLSHSNIGSLLGEWSAVAENVGYGGSVGGVFEALVGSSGHRANMLGDYSHIGVGVYRDSDGTLWTAHVFAR